jgi:hypothetical protein
MRWHKPLSARQRGVSCLRCAKHRVSHPRVAQRFARTGTDPGGLPCVRRRVLAPPGGVSQVGLARSAVRFERQRTHPRVEQLTDRADMSEGKVTTARLRHAALAIARSSEPLFLLPWRRLYALRELRRAAPRPRPRRSRLGTTPRPPPPPCRRAARPRSSPATTASRGTAGRRRAWRRTLPLPTRHRHRRATGRQARCARQTGRGRGTLQQGQPTSPLWTHLRRLGYGGGW